MFRKFESRVLCFSFGTTIIGHSIGNVSALDMKQC